MRYHLGISVFWKGKMISKDFNFITFRLYIWIYMDYIYMSLYILISLVIWSMRSTKFRWVLSSFQWSRRKTACTKRRSTRAATVSSHTYSIKPGSQMASKLRFESKFSTKLYEIKFDRHKWYKFLVTSSKFCIF